MKLRISLISIAFAILASCTQAVPESPTVPAPEAPAPCRKVLRAVLDGDTRTSVVMNGAGNHADVVWNAGDQITVTAMAGGSIYYNIFTASAGGSKEAEFSCDDFISAFDEDTPIIAVYPSSQFIGISSSGVADLYYLPLALSPVQQAVKGGVADGLNYALAYSKRQPGDETLHFKNVLSLMHFTLDGPGASSVRKAVLSTSHYSSGNGVYLLSPGGIGEADMNYCFTNEYGQCRTVTLEGTFEQGGDYYFAMIPGTSEGFSITFYDDSGNMIFKSSDITITASRSRILELGTITLDNSFSPLPSGVELYRSHTQGSNPVTIVVTGDGFTASQQDLFVNLAHAGIDKLFETEPYKTYKDWFNVYIMSAVSQESGASITDGQGNITTERNTYFKSKWGATSYSDMSADLNKVYSFVESRCPDIVNGLFPLDNLCVILLINDSRYGGICHMFSNGQAVAMVPYTDSGAAMGWPFPQFIASSDSDPTSGTRYLTGEELDAIGHSQGDWRNVVLHEFGGHAFGRLLDEYWYSSYNTSPTIIDQAWPVPAGLNVSGSYDNVPWKSALLDNKDALVQMDANYGRIGVYQGGDVSVLYRWRSEMVSCMIDNRPYYSAWQRYLIVKRIMELSGGSFNFQTFLNNDVTADPVRDGVALSTPTASGSQIGNTPVKIYPPLPPPVLIEK